MSNEPVSQDAAYCIRSISSYNITNMIKLFSLTSSRYLTCTFKFDNFTFYSRQGNCVFRSRFVRYCRCRQLCLRGECRSTSLKRKQRTNCLQNRITTTSSNKRNRLNTGNHSSSNRSTDNSLSKLMTSGLKSNWTPQHSFLSFVSTKNKALMEATRQRKYFL